MIDCYADSVVVVVVVVVVDFTFSLESRLTFERRADFLLHARVRNDSLKRMKMLSGSSSFRRLAMQPVKCVLVGGCVRACVGACVRA